MEKNLDYIKNFSTFIKHKEEIIFKNFKFHFEIEDNKIFSVTLLFDYNLNGKSLSQVLCFYGNSIEKQIIDHLTTFFEKVEIQTEQYQMDNIEKVLTFIEMLFSNIKNVYKIEQGNFYINFPFPFKDNCMIDYFSFKGIINQDEYIFEKESIEFDEFDVFYPHFLLENNIDVIINNSY